MPVKRSRIGRSTTSMDTLVRPPPAERRAAKIPAGISVRESMEEEQSVESRLGILTVSSPVKQSGAEPSRRFLERCYCCKKEMRNDADVFMYSYLRAFCSVECRARQINMDNEAAGIVYKAANGGTN